MYLSLRRSAPFNIDGEMDMHAIAGASGYVAFALADGRALDHTAYPEWSDAVKAAKWDRDNYMFIEIQPDGMPYAEADAVLKYARLIHQLGRKAFVFVGLVKLPRFRGPPRKIRMVEVDSA